MGIAKHVYNPVYSKKFSIKLGNYYPQRFHNNIPKISQMQVKCNSWSANYLNHKDMFSGKLHWKIENAR